MTTPVMTFWRRCQYLVQCTSLGDSGRFGVRLDELEREVRVAAPRDASLGGNTEFLNVLPGDGDAFRRALHAVPGVDQSEIQLGAAA